MDHVLIPDTRTQADNHIANVNGRDFIVTAKEGRDYHIWLPYVGRSDRIRVIIIEHEVHGFRFEGQLIPLGNNTNSTELVMYASHNRRGNFTDARISEDPFSECLQEIRIYKPEIIPWIEDLLKDESCSQFRM